MQLIVGVVVTCIVMSLFDVKEIIKMKAGSTKMLVLYFTLMLAAIALLSVLVGLGNLYLTDVFNQTV